MPRKRTVPERTSHPVTSPPHWWPRTPLCWDTAWVRCSGQWRQSTWWWWLQVQTSKRYLHQFLIHWVGEHWNAITEWVICPPFRLCCLYLHIPVVPPGVADGHPGPRTDHVGGWLGGFVRQQGGGETENTEEELSQHGSSCFSHLRRTMVPRPGGWYLCNQRWGWWSGGGWELLLAGYN